MIAQLRGKIIDLAPEKELLRVVLDVQGVGYEVLMTLASEPRLAAGQPATLYISESVTAFDGATTLYGFTSRDEKEFFRQIRENVDGMGPKKALETLDKVSKSLPDFKRAVIDNDQRLLVSVFGFTKKTAEKLVFALKGKVEGWAVAGQVRWKEAPKGGLESEVLSGLLNLGYAEDEARELLQKARTHLDENAQTAQVLKECLRLSGSRFS